MHSYPRISKFKSVFILDLKYSKKYYPNPIPCESDPFTRQMPCSSLVLTVATHQRPIIRQTPALPQPVLPGKRQHRIPRRRHYTCAFPAESLGPFLTLLAAAAGSKPPTHTKRVAYSLLHAGTYLGMAFWKRWMIIWDWTRL